MLKTENNIKGKGWRRTHGLSGTPEYKAWWAAVDRCTNENNPEYDNYGGRGITVCDRWLDEDKGLLNFIEDMGKRPDRKLSLDRTDNDGPYSKENWRWVDKKTQGRNRRTLLLLELNG